MNEIEELRLMIQANAIGLQNVYDEFKKYKANFLIEKIDELNKRLDHYEKEKNVKYFDLDISSFPMNIRIKMKIKTNFGEISYIFDYPPNLEYELHQKIGAAYKNLLNDLYDAHDKRGGKYIGDEGCKKWMDENGLTIIEVPSSLISN
jgi:hypothetical protein